MGEAGAPIAPWDKRTEQAQPRDRTKFFRIRRLLTKLQTPKYVEKSPCRYRSKGSEPLDSYLAKGDGIAMTRKAKMAFLSIHTGMWFPPHEVFHLAQVGIKNFRTV